MITVGGYGPAVKARTVPDVEVKDAEPAPCETYGDGGTVGGNDRG